MTKKDYVKLLKRVLIVVLCCVPLVVGVEFLFKAAGPVVTTIIDVVVIGAVLILEELIRKNIRKKKGKD